MPKLSDLNIDEVSLVRKGANQHARVAIAKSAGGEVDEEYFDQEGNPVDPDELEHGDIVFDAQGEAFQYDESGSGDADDDDEVQKSLRGARMAFSDDLRYAGGAKGIARRVYHQTNARAGQQARRGAKQVKRASGAVAGVAQTGAGHVAAGGRKVAVAAGNAGNAGASRLRAGAAQAEGFLRTETDAVNTRGRIGALGAGGLLAGGGAGYGASEYRNSRVRKSAAEELRVELSKALTDDERDDVIAKAFGYVEEAEALAAEALETAEAEREARREAEFYEVAKSYDALPVETDDLAIAMMHAADLLPEEDVDVIARCLGFAQNVVEKFYAEEGNIGGGDNVDVIAQLEAHASQYVSKGYGSPEQFTAEALSANPALYDQYLADNNR